MKSDDADSKGDEKKLADAKKELVRLKIRLERAEKAKQEDQVARLKLRIEQVEKAAGASEEKKVEEPAAPTIDAPTIVRQAYLRTLSRYPTDDELTRCVEFIGASPNPAEGAKGVLWALINTKEFIVNH